MALSIVRIVINRYVEGGVTVRKASTQTKAVKAATRDRIVAYIARVAGGLLTRLHMQTQTRGDHLNVWPHCKLVGEEVVIELT